MLFYIVICEDGMPKPGITEVFGDRTTSYSSEGRSPMFVFLVTALPGYGRKINTLERSVKSFLVPFREYNRSLTGKLEKIDKKYKKKITAKVIENYVMKELKNLPGLYKVKAEFCSEKNPIFDTDENLGTLYKRIVQLPHKYLEGFK